MATLKVGIDARQAKTGAADFNRATATMKSSAGSTTMSIERGFSSAMRRIALFGGAGGVIYTLKRFVDSASDAQETMNKFNVVFGDNAKEAAKWAETFGDKVGRATQDVQKWMVGVQDLFVPLGFARDKATELSKSMVQLAVDVGSFNNMAAPDVIRDFNSALVGNHETVRKYGIIISEAALAQEALNQKLDKSYKELTDLEKVQLRYSLIQKGTTDAQGDAVRSADDWANQVWRLKANLKETATELGGPFMESMAKVVKSINENKETWKWFVETLGEGLAEVASGFSEIRETINEFQPVYDNWLKSQNRARTGPGVYGGFGAGTMGAPPTPSKVKDGLPVGKLEISPRGYQRLAEMRANLYRMQQEEMAAQNQAPPGKYEFVGPPELSAEERQKLIDEARDLAHKRADITARMYQDMGQLGTGYYESQKALLDLEREDYSQFIEDKVLLDEWYSSKLNQIAIESSGFWLETRDALLSSQSALSDFMMDFESLEGLIGSVGNAFQRMFANLASQLAMSGIMTLLVGGDMAGAMGFTNPLAGMGKVQMGGLLGGLFGGGNLPALSTPGGSTGMGYALGGVMSNGRIVPMANGAILDRPTYFPMAEGNVGKAGEAGPELGFFPLRRNRGRLGIDASGGTPNITVSPTPVKVVFVKNMREAAIEAIKSSEGENVIVEKVLRNRNLFR